jgi:hypothetical protein
MRKALTSSICFIFLYTNVILAKTIPVKNPGNDKDIQPNFQAAVNSAINGDVIELPAGQFIVNKSVIITKFLSIKGKGINTTILYRSENISDAILNNSSDWDGILKFNINSNVPSSVWVSDISLKSKKPSLVDGDGLSLAADIGIKMVKCIDFVITRCRFEYFGNGAVSVIHDDSLASGLIYKNEFIHNVKGYDGLGLGYGVVIYGSNKKWISSPRFGSSNFIFIEDNIFDYHRHSVAAGGAALYVFRYNTVNNNNIGEYASHAIDAHEGHGGPLGNENYFSTRAIEAYNNKIVNKTFIDGNPIIAGKNPGMLVEAAVCIRGGEAAIHDNYIEGYRFGVGLFTSLAGVFPDKYVIPYQQGYLSGLKYGANHTGSDAEKGNGDDFIWNNNFIFYAPGHIANTFFYNYSSSYIKSERDYHLSAKPAYKTYIYPHPLRDRENSLQVDETGIGQNDFFAVFPNPVSGVINIQAFNNFKTIAATYQLIDIHGTVIINETPILVGLTSINIDNQIAKGIYFVKISTANANYINKVIIQ